MGVVPSTISRDFYLPNFLYSPNCHVLSGDRQALLCTHDLLSARSFYRRQSDRSNETSGLGSLDCIKCLGLVYQGSYRHLILSLDSTSAPFQLPIQIIISPSFSGTKCSYWLFINYLGTFYLRVWGTIISSRAVALLILAPEVSRTWKAFLLGNRRTAG